MTLLHWEDVDVSKELVDALKAVVLRYDKPYARRASPKLGQSFLFDPSRSPPVCPDGPLANMLQELDDTAAVYCKEVKKEEGSSGASVERKSTRPAVVLHLKSVPLEELHVSAPLLRHPQSGVPKFDATTLELRHSPEEAAWGRKSIEELGGGEVHELPFCLQFVAHLCPIPSNALLHNWMLGHGVPSDAQRIADSRTTITSAGMARREVTTELLLLLLIVMVWWWRFSCV